MSSPQPRGKSTPFVVLDMIIRHAGDISAAARLGIAELGIKTGTHAPKGYKVAFQILLR